MTPTLIKAAYFGSWIAIAAGTIYAVMAAGYSFGVAAALAWVLFFFGNGSVAYILRSRQLRRQGEQPPSFFKYLFFPSRSSFTRKMAVPRPVRIGLGMLFICGGLFLLMGAVIAVSVNFSGTAHSARGVIAMVVLSVVGLGIGYVGFRLIVVKNDEPLLRRSNAEALGPGDDARR